MHEVSVPFNVLLPYLHLPPLIPHQPQAVPVTFSTSSRPRSNTVLRCKEMVSADESFSHAGYEPNNYFLTET